jgi:hypoxanthine-guanine phosphoribosyltransferase
MLTESVKNEHLIIVPDLIEKGESFSFEHDVCCGCVIYSLSYGDI